MFDFRKPPQRLAISWLLFLLVVGTATLGLAGCGDDDSGSGTRIVVMAATSPEGLDQKFEFVTDYEDESFFLKDGEMHESSDLEPGTYSVMEAPLEHWQPASATCSDDQAPEHIDLTRGQTVTCSFLNSPTGPPIDSATILVRNVADGAGSTEFGFEAGPDAATFTLHDGETHEMSGLAPGTYAVRQSETSGFHQSGAACDNGDSPNAISLEVGDTVVCTFTSVEDESPPPGTGQILVVQVTDDGSAQQFIFTASFSSGGFDLQDGEQQNSGPLAPGTYSVSQAIPAGWETSASCSDGSDAASIDLVAGETVTCTFTSTKQAPAPAQIVVVQVTEPGTEKFAFKFTASYASAGFALANGMKDTSGDLVAGTYVVSQQVPVGWATSSQCSDGADPANIPLSAGQTVTCTFTTTKLAPGERQVHFVYMTNDSACTTATFTTPAPANHVIELTLESVVSGKYIYSGTIPAGTPKGQGTLHVKCSNSDSWSTPAV